MKLILALMLLSSIVQAGDYTQSYYRHDGTYVQGYYHTQSNSNPYDNYSYRPTQPQPTYVQPSYVVEPTFKPYNLYQIK